MDAILKGRSPIAKFYDTIFYATMLHSVDGHFKVKNGVSVFDPDEEQAQSERGGYNVRLLNLAATVFFWLTVIEGRKEFDQDDVIDFLGKNNALYREIITRKLWVSRKPSRRCGKISCGKE